MKFFDRLTHKNREIIRPADLSRATGSTIARSGIGILVIEAEHPDRVIADAQHVMFDSDGRIHMRHGNAYVRSGLRSAIQREFGLGGTVVTGIGVASSTSAVTVNTRFLNGATAGTNGPTAGENVRIKAISPAATIVTDGASVAQAVTAGATFVNADFNGGIPFIWSKLGLTLAVPATAGLELDGNLVDVIGGTAGSAPYNRTFTLDLTGAGTFSVTAQIEVTASAA